MKSAEIFIVANGSLVRALKRSSADPSLNEGTFRLEELSVDPSMQVLLEDEPVDSDRPGRFEGGTGAGQGNNLVHGDRNRADLEREKRHGLALAEGIGRIITQQNLRPWCLLAPRSWISPIEDGLPASVKKRMVGSDAVDLTHHSLKDIEMRLASN